MYYTFYLAWFIQIPIMYLISCFLLIRFWYSCSSFISLIVLPIVFFSKRGKHHILPTGQVAGIEKFLPDLIWSKLARYLAWEKNCSSPIPSWLSTLKKTPHPFKVFRYVQILPILRKGLSFHRPESFRALHFWKVATEECIRQGMGVCFGKEEDCVSNSWIFWTR